MMSKLKEKLAAKLTELFEEEVNPDDIDFWRNGCRTDVVRWSVFGYDCFSSAGHCIKSHVKLSLSEDCGWDIAPELHAEPPCC